MPITAICPVCQTAYQVADQLDGKKIRCKKCQGIVQVGAPPTVTPDTGRPTGQANKRNQPAAPIEDFSPKPVPPNVPRPQRQAEEDEAPRRRPEPRRSQEDDEDDFESPRRKRSGGASRHRSKNTAVWIICASIVGVVVLVAGGVIIWLMVRKESKPAAQRPIPAPPVDQLTLTDLRKVSPDGTFRVLLPAAYKEKVEKIEGATVRMWGIEEGSRGLAVLATQVPELVGMSPDELEAGMMSGQDDQLRLYGATAVKAEKVKLASGQPGRYVEGVNAARGLTFKGRMYAVGDRLIQLIAQGPKPWIDAPEITQFLDSLELTAGKAEPIPDKTDALTEARKGFKTKLVRRESALEPAPQPPPQLFRTVRYDAPVGKLAAYLTPDPKDGQKHPAIIWITGGNCNSLDEGCWQEGPANNDQSASAYRKAGIVMLFPSLRGGHSGLGVKESFLGEVDDVLAAADFLAQQSYVDPARIYLGGHSTGGTLALLVAECSGRFRAVFSFGPADNVAGYGPEFTPFDTTNPLEIQLRSPGRWLAAIKSPTFVFEGTIQGNLGSLQTMAKSSTNPKVRFLPIRGATHFSLLAPTNRLIAAKILLDNGPACNLTFTEEEVIQRLGK